MDIVLDASAIIAVITNEPTRDQLVALTIGADLIAPHSIHWEIGNAFSAMLKRERIGPRQALAAIMAYQQIPIRFVDVELDLCLKIAGDLNLYAYDAYLLRAAQKYRSPLLTLDQRVTQAARELQLTVLERVCFK